MDMRRGVTILHIDRLAGEKDGSGTRKDLLDASCGNRATGMEAFEGSPQQGASPGGATACRLPAACRQGRPLIVTYPLRTR